MAECPKCGAVYTVQRSIELQQKVRNICKCEQGRACGHQKRGKKPCGLVRQALLDVDGNVELYVCEVHAANDCLDDPAPSKEKPKAPKIPKEPKSEKLAPPMSVAAFIERVAPLDYLLICLVCKNRHPFNKRKVVMEVINKKPIFSTFCPNCDVGMYEKKGPPWDMTYMSAADYDNPPKPKPATNAAPKKARK